MMEAVSTSKTPENFYQSAQRNFPEDSHFLTTYAFAHIFGTETNTGLI
jgi:hypothetical protein